MTTIEDNMFSNCGKLMDVTIPESVTEIHFTAFRSETVLHVKAGSYAEGWCKGEYSNNYFQGHSNYVVE